MAAQQTNPYVAGARLTRWPGLIEHYRREKAMLWLGQEMPQWPEPCPLRVSVTINVQK